MEMGLPRVPSLSSSTLRSMAFQARALAELRARRGNILGKHTVAGFDGFVDTIVTPVAKRSGPGEAFEPIADITQFAQRIQGAAGKSTNIEYYPRMDKLGGNGPLMANALLAGGSSLTYIGAIGRGHVHPVFADLAARSKAVYCLTEPALTTAVEFLDGKIMFGQTKTLDNLAFPALRDAMGPALRQEFGEADLVALVNWTMITHMTALFRALRTEVLAKAPARARRFFFDLADPEKRSEADLREAIAEIAKFEEFGKVTLGLNFKEAQQVTDALQLPALTEETESALTGGAAAIRKALAIDCVVVHPRKSAACATADGVAWVPGPYCEKPLITTGAGDHFNGGFSLGQLLGASPETCLALGVCTSGHYVRTAESPTLDQLETFLAQWA